jgi:uncharacterized membrane protein YqiK
MVSSFSILVIGIFILGLGILLFYWSNRSDKALEWDEERGIEVMILVGAGAIVYVLFFG